MAARMPRLPPLRREASVQRRIARVYPPDLSLDEDLRHIRMPDRFADSSGKRILLGHIGDVLPMSKRLRHLLERVGDRLAKN